MKTYQLVLGTLAVTLTSISFAQQSAPAAQRPTPREMAERHAERFKAADTDKDGAISKAEAEKAMPRLAAHFDLIDTNKDGKLSQEELQAMAAHMRHGRHGRHFGPFGADANRDGVVTRDELVQHQQKMLRDFDTADTNKDGKLDHEEMRAWHEKMRAERPQAPKPPVAK